MEKAIEFANVNEVVKDSEASSLTKNKGRTFEYDLNDKNTKAKLLKGAKRPPFEVVCKTGSTNLIFNLGSWSKIVLQSIEYWNCFKDDKTCKIGSSVVKISSLKTGVEAGGKHVDTQIVFFINREKAVCHFYNTTQLIMVNGHGCTKLVEEFLEPYFQSKINMNLDEIQKYNEQALDNLGSKTVKRGSVRYKGGSKFPCYKCDFVTNTLSALGKHSRSEHTLGISSISLSSAPALPLHSTRNNSIVEVNLQEDMTITDLSIVNNKAKDQKR